MAVDFVRRCYRSEWYLFSDAADVATPGVYYFNDAAPEYPGFHLYGSRSWYPESHALAQGLGERLDNAQPWFAGQPPAWPVRSTFVGSPECIASGEMLANAIDYNETFDGIIDACIIKQNPEDVLWSKLSDYNNCNVQRMYTFVIMAIANDDENAIRSVLTAFLGVGPAIAYHPSNGVFNGVVTVTSATWQLVIINGTENAQQFALQAFVVPLGPLNFGGFSTSPFWYAASDSVVGKMLADGQTAAMRLMIVGHSYGAVVGLICAARNRQADVGRKINFLTFGCPKIGDRRLVELVESCAGLNIANEGDIVTILPPDRYLLAPLIPLFPLLPLYLWQEWERPKPQVLLRPDGSMEANLPTPMDTVTILALVTQMLAMGELDPVVPHYTITYNGRLFARCPDCCFPCVDEVCEQIIVSNPVLAWTMPRRARTGLIWGPGVPIAIPDGSTCLLAIPLALATTYSVPTIPTTKSWFRVIVPANRTMRITGTNLTGFFQIYSQHGTDCAHLTTFDVLSISGGTAHTDWPTFTDTVWWLQCRFPTAGFSIRVDDIGP